MAGAAGSERQPKLIVPYEIAAQMSVTVPE